FGRTFHACYNQQTKNLIVAIGQIDDQFATGRRQSDEVLMLDRYAATVRHVDQEGTERLRVQKLANLVDLHEHDDTTTGKDDKSCHFAGAAIAFDSSNYVVRVPEVQSAMFARFEHRPNDCDPAVLRAR